MSLGRWNRIRHGTPTVEVPGIRSVRSTLLKRRASDASSHRDPSAAIAAVVFVLGIGGSASDRPVIIVSATTAVEVRPTRQNARIGVWAVFATSCAVASP